MDPNKLISAVIIMLKICNLDGKILFVAYVTADLNKCKLISGLIQAGSSLVESNCIKRKERLSE